MKYADDEETDIAVLMKNSLPDILLPTYIETAEFACLHDEGIAYAKHIPDVAKNIEVNNTKGTEYPAWLDRNLRMVKKRFLSEHYI